MKYMKGETFKVVRKSQACPISTKWVDTDKTSRKRRDFL